MLFAFEISFASLYMLIRLYLCIMCATLGITDFESKTETPIDIESKTENERET